MFNFWLKGTGVVADAAGTSELTGATHPRSQSQMKLFTKRRAIFALTTALLVVVVGGAYAYFTTTGTGTGTASVGSGSTVTLHATVTGTLYPGTSSPVSFTVDNPSSGKQRVGVITLSSITVDAGHSECSTVITGGTPDFTMPAVAVNATFASGNAQAVTPTGSLTMNDTGVSQDKCQGATLTLHLTNS
jgi:uncharacterized protein YaiE (UPF0345 family)